MSLLSILGIGNGRIKEALRSGAIVIDVRSASEFDRGKLRGSLNIPVDRININIRRIGEMRKPLILCSNSYSETESAIRILKAKGIMEAYNGGSWLGLLRIARSL